MTLSSLLLGIWLILVGVVWAGWATIDAKFLGLWAVVTGVLWLVEQKRPIQVL